MHERPCHRLDLPKIAHSTAALSPTPLSLNCTRISPQPPGDFVFLCHNGPFATGVANRLKEPRKRMSCVATFAAHSNSFVYPSVFAELAQKSRQTHVAKMSSCKRLTVPPFCLILNSRFLSFCCNPNCFVHTRKHPPDVERLVFVQTCNINVRLSIKHHNVLFLLQRVQHVKIRNVPSTRTAFPTARLRSLRTHAIKSGQKPNNLDDTLW